MTDQDELRDAAYARVLAIEAAADAELLLRRGGAWEALIEKARDEALGAMEMLISTPFTDLAQVKDLQWQVSRYDALCRWVKEIEDAGEAAHSDMSADEEFIVGQMLSRGETEPQDA
jgi:hypothetical protein